MDQPKRNEKIKLIEINSYLTCHLCKGYLIDATTISECLHSFCRSCIIKFLQENSHCPVCEVMINKAKPNIKLDKTLQDIVYKLVPELFLREMRRRQRFYRDRPAEAARATPEERGEDTERTIFSPSDTISLSIEYISDDSTPGAIVVPPPPPQPSPAVAKSAAGGGSCDAPEQDSTIRRFLQCPGMCRVDVLKKFVRNKYNVDTNRFYIDILYKKVPLPDHYTLIDIAYIYSWKRNEPMKFFFRITDINTVTERFDYLGPKPSSPPPVAKVEKTAALESAPVPPAPEKPPIVPVKEEKPVKTVRFQLPEKRKKATTVVVAAKPEIAVDAKQITEELKNRIQKEPLSEKSSVYTNITLNRSNNVEIITKIQKVSNRNGQPIGLNIIKQTVKKSKPALVPVKKEEVVKDDRLVEVKKEEVKVKIEPPDPILPAPVPTEVDLEKSNFLKSIELTAKSSLPAVSPQKVAALETPATSQQSQKRKNPSPMKSEKPAKKTKVFKLNPAVRQIVSNVNQSATNVTKIVERNAPNKDLQTLFDNCKINIPSSLSITLKESSDGDVERRTPVTVKPVQNYIEILRLPDKDKKRSDGGDVVKQKNHSRSPQTFQKMFEEAIKKPEFTKSLEAPSTKKEQQQKSALDLSDKKTEHVNKKVKIEQEKNGKVVIPRLNSQKTPPPPSQQTVDCHSASLGMNYKVSVSRNGTPSPNKIVSSSTVSPSPKSPSGVLPKPTSSLSVTTTTNTPSGGQSLSPNQLLEKYNIQNLAQLTASFNLNAMGQAGHLAALQQAMILKHFEIQNRQNWLNMNPSPLVQYEKYLQSLQGQNQLLGKEN